MQERTPVQNFRYQEKRQRYIRGSFLLQIGILLLFLLVPFLFPSFKAVDLAMKIVIFASLVASFDILLGYTGILSFGHGMFFGIGAYCVAFLLEKYGSPSYFNLVLGLLLATIVATVLALLISFISLRVKAIYFAMVTLALAELLGPGGQIHSVDRDARALRAQRDALRDRFPDTSVHLSI